MGAFLLGVFLAVSVAAAVYVFEAFSLLPADVQVLIFLLALLPLVIAWSWSFAIARSVAAMAENRYLAVLVVVFGVIGSYYLYQEGENTPLVACIAATFATLGWVLQRQLSVNMNRKQHTLNILTQMRQSELFSNHRHNIFKKYTSSQVVPKADIALIKANCENSRFYTMHNGCPVYPIGESIKYVCNYYEFLASAVREGDLDDKLLRSSIESHFRAVCENFEHYIFDELSGTPTTYKNLIWLVTERWKCCKFPENGA